PSPSLRRRFEAGNEPERAQIFHFYVRHRRLVCSWDAVDESAPNIVGPYLLDRHKGLLYELARSHNLWERRIAMVSTLYFIRRVAHHRYSQAGQDLNQRRGRPDSQSHRLDAARGW